MRLARTAVVQLAASRACLRHSWEMAFDRKLPGSVKSPLHYEFPLSLPKRGCEMQNKRPSMRGSQKPTPRPASALPLALRSRSCAVSIQTKK